MCAGRLVAPAPTRGRPMRPVDDRVAAPCSWLARMDPLAKLCAALATILVTSTLPTAAGWRYPAVLALLICIAAVAAVPARYLLRRALAATPFVVMAAAMPVVSGVPDGAAMALAVGWKAYSAIVTSVTARRNHPNRGSHRVAQASGRTSRPGPDGNPDAPVPECAACGVATNRPRTRLPRIRAKRGSADSPLGESGSDGVRPRMGPGGPRVPRDARTRIPGRLSRNSAVATAR